MLNWLRIQQLILVESAEILFRPGLNILSGETGSGKSAIMEALSLILGERADKSKIRKGEEKATIDATFEISSYSAIEDFLKESGIDHDSQDDLSIRREITASGKSRAFVNNQPVQLATLQKIGRRLVKFVGQHANQQLFDLTQHREILDQYAENVSLRREFSQSWQKQKSLYSQIEQLKDSEARRLRETEICEMEIKEIQEASIKEDEEEKLFEEYRRLSHADELMQHGTIVVGTLLGEKQSILSSMSRIRGSLQKLTSLDPQLEENSKQFQQAYIELQDIGQNLENYLGKIEQNPEKMNKINDRLKRIEKIKKKYGPTCEHVQEYLKNSLVRLDDIQNIDQKIEQYQKEWQKIEEVTHKLALKLTTARKNASEKMEKEMTQHLRELNMPNVEFHVKIGLETRTIEGDDSVEFFLTPNRGESPISVKECASGGEISRLMLSLQVLLAGKEMIPTMVFDEIDANIGGKTADDVGKKLHNIGTRTQVLCITHFPQVAHYADHHIQISKQERQERTFTTIQVLNQKTRKKEIERMAGLIT